MKYHPQHHPSYFKAKSFLRTKRDKEVAVRQLIAEDKLAVSEAYDLVRYAYDNNIQTGRRNGMAYMIGSGAVAVLLLLIFIYLGRLYYIFLPISLFSFFKGLHEFVTTNGFDG